MEFLSDRLSTDSSKVAVGSFGEALFNSDGLDNAFLTNFLTGRRIETNDKDRISERLVSSTRAGGDLNLGLFGVAALNGIAGWKPYQLQWYTMAADRQHIDVRFPPNLFELAFYGNKRFAGDTAFLGDFELNFLRYQEFQLGLITNNGKGRTLGLGLSVIKGEENWQIEVPNTTFFTSETGEFLEVSSQASILRTDTNNRGQTAVNGLGASVNFFYKSHFTLLEHDRLGLGTIDFEVNNLGWISWNDQSIGYEIDTTYQFEGIVIDNLQELNDSILQASSPDTLLDDLREKQNRQKYRTTLPTTFSLRIAQEHSKGFSLALGAIVRLQANYAPYLFLSETYRVNRLLSVQGSAGYGGYGRWNAGVQCQLNPGNFRILIGTRHLNGWIAPKEYAGGSLYLTLKTVF